MRRGIEAAAFVGVAVGLHLAAFAVELPDHAGATAAGEGGDAQVSIAAAPEQVAALVEEWDRPPEVETAVPVEAPPAASAPAAPEVPSSLTESSPRGAPVPQMPDLAQAPVDAVDVPRALPGPEPEVEPEPEEAVGGIRPERRPERPDPPQPQPEPERDPQPAPQQPQHQSLPQRASGQGGGENAGQARRAEAATVDPARIESLRSRWGARIRAQVERRKSYPSGARGAAGTAVVRMSVDASGRLRSADLAGSSGSRALDEAAVRAVRGAGRFPAAPAELGGGLTFQLPMQFDP